MHYFLYFGIIIFSSFVTASTADFDLTYHIDYQQQTITLEFIGDQSGTTAIILPNEQYGNKKLYQELSNIRVNKGEIIATNHEHVKVLKHPPASKLIISYNFSFSTQNHTNLKLARKAILDKEYFHFIGGTLFIVPRISGDKILNCNMHWELPSNWNFASSFGNNIMQQKYIGKIDDLINGLFIGGDFRMHFKKVHNKDVCIALHGSWPFTDNALVINLAKIIALERDFWHDINYPFFLVSAIPIYQQENIISGLGLKNAFCLFISENQTLDANLNRLLIHEYFHTWNTPKLFANLASKQIEFLWFTEGFTDYYTDLLALRSQTITLLEYLANYNKNLLEYYTSSALNIKNPDIKDKFWDNYDCNKIAYQRGYILAHNWNALIKLNSLKNLYSLDNVMKDLRLKYHEINNNYKNNNNITINNLDKNLDAKLTSKDIIDLVSSYANYNAEKDFKNHIEEGKTIYPHPKSLGKCIKYKINNYSIVNPGFDIKSSVLLGKITNVLNDSVAYKAGLRNGQDVLNIKYDPTNSNTPIKVVINENGSAKEQIFHSAETKNLDIPQFYLIEELIDQNPKECLAWFGKIQGEL